MLNGFKMAKRRGHFLPLVVTFASLLASAQVTPPSTTKKQNKVAVVTFFSNPFTLTGGLPGKQSEAFRGRLFVDKDQLGYVGSAQFFSIQFVPGDYEFTATTWMAAGPAGGAHLKMNLAAGRHYFIELRTKVSFPFSKAFGIKEVSCAETYAIAAKMHQVKAGDMKPAATDNFVDEKAFPKCSLESGPS